MVNLDKQSQGREPPKPPKIKFDSVSDDGVLKIQFD